MNIEAILTETLVEEIMHDIRFMDDCILEVMQGDKNNEGLLGLIQEME